MTPSQINEALAGWMGTAFDELGIEYKDGTRSFGNSEEYTRQKCANYQRRGLGCKLVWRRTCDEDYVSDLDACAEVEARLTDR